MLETQRAEECNVMTDPLRELLREAREIIGMLPFDESQEYLCKQIDDALLQQPKPVAYRFHDPHEWIPSDEPDWCYEDDPEFLKIRREEGRTLEPLFAIPPSTAALIAEKDWLKELLKTAEKSHQESKQTITEQAAEIERLNRFFESKSAKSFYVAWKEADKRAEAAERALAQVVHAQCSECGRKSTVDGIWALYCLDCIGKMPIIPLKPAVAWPFASDPPKPEKE